MRAFIYAYGRGIEVGVEVFGTGAHDDPMTGDITDHLEIMSRPDAIELYEDLQKLLWPEGVIDEKEDE